MLNILKVTLTTFALLICLQGCNSSNNEEKPTPPITPTPPVAPAPPVVPAPPEKVDDTEIVNIPAGEFTMGCNADDYSSCELNKPARKVYLDAYSIDKYKVTYRRYQECIDAGTCTALFAGGGCNANMEWNSDHPVNCVDYNQASTFCEFEAKRLPTEAEWEKAARGTDGRKYPWGNDAPSCALAVINKKTDGNIMGPGCGAGTTQPIATKPKGASPYGVMGMAGNLFEWTSDWFSDGDFAQSSTENPTGPKTGEHKVLRGSSWLMRTDDGIASVVRSGYSPLGQGYVVGFRCASSA